jgi:hypothetical protein
MQECLQCKAYFKKLGYNYQCKTCHNCAYNCTSSPNNALAQKNKLIDASTKNKIIQNKYKTAPLLLLSALALIDSKPKLCILFENLPEGNLPWYALLRAWYIKNNKKGRSIDKELYPMTRLRRLLKYTE